ncbi:DUF937 domain-containing protein [Salegentibacter sp. F188]|uniref:DUF937 domain-containing protein n=1 Tax=Autumnicola patrickiae TaxID=3075591 RepID=A0ABU3E3M3_9FLAO|nr:DUF937 domain-containing protein [Salegentibacter sp. F188]MDT0690556.1 DUF937 domain-containing protein [Salegentibacter sp. F188]
MASILDILNTTPGENLIDKASKETNEDKDNITSALVMGMPLILGALKNNSEKEEGAKALDEALENEKHKGDLLENLQDSETGELTGEGAKVLGHVLGGQKDIIEETLSKTLGMSKDSISTILKLAAPVIMSLLGSQKRIDRVKADGLPALIESLMGASAAHDSSLIESLLDRNRDGKIIDDVAGMVLGGGKKGKEDGSILGGFTGGK